MNILKTKSDAVTTLRWTREVASIGGAATGVTVMWGLAYFTVADATGSRLVGTAAAAVGSLVGLFIMDFSYRRNFPYVADLIVSGQAFKNWRIFLFTFFLLLLSMAQMASSGLLSWEGRKDVAEGIIRAPDLADIAAIKVAADKSTSAKIREVKAEIASLAREISEREKEVEKSYPAFVEKIKAGSDKWGWYAKELDKKKGQSVGSLRQQHANLSEALSELVGSQSASDKLVIESVAIQNTAKMQQFSDKKDRNMRFLGYFGVGCLFVVAFVSIMLSLVGYSDLEEMDMKETRKPFRQAAPPTATAPAPGGVVHISSAGATADAWEMQRRQQMAEAKIAEIEARHAAEMRQAEARRAEEARHAAELARQERDRADKMAAALDKVPTTPQPKPLSDKGSDNLSEKLSELSAHISDKGISVEGKTYGVSELSKLKDKSQKWYTRQFTSSTEAGRESNRAKWEEIKKIWEGIGAKLVYSGQKVSIEGGNLKA